MLKFIRRGKGACPICGHLACDPNRHLWQVSEENKHVESSGVQGMAIAKPVGMGGDRGRDGGNLGGEWPVLFPTICEYLTEDRYADQTAREVSTLLLFVESGQAKLCLNDRDTGRTAWVTGGSVEEALSSMEDRLAGGRMEWRDNTNKGKSKGKK